MERMKEATKMIRSGKDMNHIHTKATMRGLSNPPISALSWLFSPKAIRPAVMESISNISITRYE